MALILNIESSSNICSIALSRNGKLISLKESDIEKSHAEKLTVFIEEILEENNIPVNTIDAIAVSKGPGSYTGLRIGVSVAKGMCYALKKPLIAIDTMQLLSQEIINEPQKYSLKRSNNKNTLLCPMIDARRMEVYAGIFDFENNRISEVQSFIIENISFKKFLDKTKVVFFGNGSEKCKGIIIHNNALFIDNIVLSAKHMGSLAEKDFNKENFADLAYFEPFYLKDFIAIKPKKNILFDE